MINYVKRILKFIIKYIVSIILYLYSATLGVFTKKGRELISLVSEHYGAIIHKNVTLAKLPTIMVSDLINSNAINLIEPNFKAGNVSLEELVIINGIIMKNKPKRIFEIGTFDGRTTVNMALNSPVDCSILTLDLTKEELRALKFEINEYDRNLTINKKLSGERFLNLNQEIYPQVKKIIQLFGDSANFNFTPYYNIIDLVFIDGAHSYEYVINDSNVAFKLLRNGKGIILWHDYNNIVEVGDAIETIRNFKKDLNFFHIENTTLVYVQIK